MGRNKRKEKQRRSKVHAEQMHMLELSCDPNIVPLALRIQLLHRLQPKYLIRAIDETLQLQLVSGNDQVLKDIRSKLITKEITVKQAMEVLNDQSRLNLGIRQTERS